MYLQEFIEVFDDSQRWARMERRYYTEAVEVIATLVILIVTSMTEYRFDFYEDINRPADYRIDFVVTMSTNPFW